MSTLTERILEANWSERVFTERQLARLLDGTPQRRYNLVNRALYGDFCAFGNGTAGR